IIGALSGWSSADSMISAAVMPKNIQALLKRDVANLNRPTQANANRQNKKAGWFSAKYRKARMAAAAPAALPARRMPPCHSETDSDARVTRNADMATHHGLSECSARAAVTPSPTESAAHHASWARGPLASSPRNSVARAAPNSRSISANQ